MLIEAARVTQTSTEPLIRVEGLIKEFSSDRSLMSRFTGAKDAPARAVDGVNLTIFRGETLGVIGESGCGKTTLGRTILRLIPPTAGTVFFDDIELTHLPEARLKPMRRRMQIVFQDPYASLNPRKSVRTILSQPLEIHTRERSPDRQIRVRAMIEQVGLASSHLDRYPHEFSGGQRQRIGIARALILNPDFLVCDEPVSALDVSIQAQILALLQDLKAKMNLTLLFISHDLAVIGTLSDRIAVMYRGKIVELGTARDVITSPAHPYTQLLLESAPRLDRPAAPRKTPPSDDVPPRTDASPGCKFHPRCPKALDICQHVEPASVAFTRGHDVSCHLYKPPG